MTAALDIAADAFQTELDGILRGLVQTVNEEAADIVAKALEPTAESHKDLKTAAESARKTVKNASDLLNAVKKVKEQLSSTLSTTESLNQQLTSAIDTLEKNQLDHEKAIQTRLAEIDESVRGRGTVTLITIIVCSLVLLVTVIGFS